MADETTPETELTTPENGEKPAGDGSAERVAALEAEVADLKSRMLHTLADMENLRKRTEREMADARQYAVANFAREILNVADNLRRALDTVPADKRGESSTLTTLLEGVEVTERGLAQTLQKFGVKVIEAKGEKFDPGKHQAMFEVERADLPSGTVADVVQAGYTIGERVLRPAMVGVSKGGPKAAPKAASEASNGEAPAGEEKPA